MGGFCDIVSMYGANLEGHQQAEKLKRAFVKFPPLLISVAIGEVYKKFEEHFQRTLLQILKISNAMLRRNIARSSK